MVPENLTTTIRNWTSGEFPGFVSCVNVLSYLKDSDGKVLVELIHALRDRVRLLPEHLVRQLFEPLKNPSYWRGCDINLTEQMVQLLVSIAVNFNDLSQDVVDLLVVMMLTEPAPSVTDDKTVSVRFFIHFMEVAPQSESLIVGRFLDKFPGWRRPLKDLLWPTMKGLFLFCSPETAKFLSASSRSAFVTKLCRLLIDLEFSLDDTEAETVRHIVDLPVDNQDFKSIHCSTCRYIEEKLSADADNGWIKLDLLTWVLLSHLRFLYVQAGSAKRELDWTLLCTAFKQMRELFSQHCLPSSTCLTAFPLVFLFTTTLRGGLMVSLTEFLWTTVRDEHKVTESRINALSFLTLLMARFSACFLDLVIELLHEMAGWCVDYVYRNRSRLSRTKFHDLPQTHKVYYAVCDSLFYIITQLHASIFESPHYRSNCDRLPLAQIMLSPLDPLSHMKRTLRDSISALVSAYKLGWGMMTVGMTPYPEASLTIHQLEELEPSSSFSLPFSTPRLPMSESFLPRLLRRCCLGKPVKSMMESPSRIESSTRKRQRPDDMDFLVIDSSKLTRIIRET